MESISKRTGKKFTGKFAETAIRIGLADPVEGSGGDEQGVKSPAKPSEKKAKEVKEPKVKTPPKEKKEPKTPKTHKTPKTPKSTEKKAK